MSIRLAVDIGGTFVDAMELDTRTGRVRFRNLKTGRCLDSYPGRVYTNTCNGGDYQIWKQFPDQAGRVFKNTGSQRCLDSNAARSVYAMPCNGGDYQVWSVTPNGDNHFNLKDKATGFVLDSNEEGQVYAFDANDGDYQRWSRH